LLSIHSLVRAITYNLKGEDKMINYNFKIELTSGRTIYTNAEFTSGDVNGYRLNFTFFDNGKQISTSGMMLLIKAKRQDGVIVTDMGTTENISAYYDVKSSVISVCGDISIEVALSDVNGMYVTTKELICSVRQGHGDGGINAENTAPVLQTVVSQAQEAKVVSQNALETGSEALSLATDAQSIAQSAIDILETKADNAALLSLAGQCLMKRKLLGNEIDFYENTEPMVFYRSVGGNNEAHENVPFSLATVFSVSYSSVENGDTRPVHYQIAISHTDGKIYKRIVDWRKYVNTNCSVLWDEVSFGVDDAFSDTSIYPVQNKVITKKFTSLDSSISAIREVIPKVSEHTEEINNIKENAIESFGFSDAELGEFELNCIDGSQKYVYLDVAARSYVDNKIGEIETALDNIIAIQNTLIGGSNV